MHRENRCPHGLQAPPSRRIESNRHRARYAVDEMPEDPMTTHPRTDRRKRFGSCTAQDSSSCRTRGLSAPQGWSLHSGSRRSRQPARDTAATPNRPDRRVTRDELLIHAETLARSVAVPISVDSERRFADDPASVAETVRLLAETGAAGCSIEDYEPRGGSIDPLEAAGTSTYLDAAIPGDDLDAAFGPGHSST